MNAALLSRTTRCLIALLGFTRGVVGPELVAAEPLASLRYEVVGSELRASPSSVAVPRNVPGSILVQFVRGDGLAGVQPVGEAGVDGRIEATLRGPAFPAQRVIGQPGEPLLLPPLRVAGDYQLDDLRLVRGSNTVLQANPSSIPVHVFDEVLVSRVTSRPLSLEEIRDKGIALDEANFRVVEFDVTLVLRGKSFRVFMPVAAPKARLSTEIIPAAELEDRTVALDQLNRDLARTVELPPEVAVEMPDFRMNAIHFEEVLDGEEEESRGIPIAGLLVIPGNVAFLNQFFSVQLFTENAAPADSGLVVDHLRATIRLPVGSDGVPGRSYAEPGDDPLRVARVGAGQLQRTNLPVVLAGADARFGTDDDVTRLQPGDTGSAEFLVEGLQEGLHLLDLDLEADLEGLVGGVRRIRGRTSGSVLVRNANFSLTFAHPYTVRAGEPYEAAVTLLNTSDVEANLVGVSLNKLALSGVVLLSDERVELGHLGPGESATATFRFRSQRTGSVYFSNLTTSDDSVKGRLSLFAGVDERGVALSPDSIGYPEWVTALPADLFAAANRVLGQALSVATAGRLPSHVRRTTTKVVEDRVIELAEAGQRLRYGDDPRRVLADLALDWQGGRKFDAGFDQIVRETSAGREWRDALAWLQESGDTGSAPQRLAGLASNYAGLGQAWWFASGDTPELEVSAEIVGVPVRESNRTHTVTVARSDISQSLAYRGVRGTWLASRPDTNLVYTWRATTALAKAGIGFLEIGADGAGERSSWNVAALAAGDELIFQPGAGQALLVRPRGVLSTLEPERQSVREEAPTVVSVRQDISVVSDRVFMRCPIREYGNWGTVLAVLFSKPMNPAHLSRASAFSFPDGNGARTVQLQPGRRVLLLQLHRGIGSFAVRPRDYSLQIDRLADPRGNYSTSGSYPVLTPSAKGASLRGRVYGVDGHPVSRVPVTLTMEDRVGNKCLPAEFRAGQVFTDDNGFFALDFVLADVPFTLAALDTSRMSDEDARTLLGALLEAQGPNGADRARLEELAREPRTRDAMLRAFNLGQIGEAIVAAEGLDRAVYRDLIPQGSGRDGSEIAVALRFRGRAALTGRVLAASGAPLPGAAVNLFPDSESRELGRGVFTGADGSFAFQGVPLGEFTLNAETRDGRRQIVADRLLAAGEVREFDLVVPDLPQRFGGVRGLVLEADGTPHPAARVFVAQQVRGTSAIGVVASTTADPEGYFQLTRIPASTWDVAAVSVDGQRRGVRSVVQVTDGGDAQVQVTLESTATLRGIVRYWDGTPAPNAKVGGGDHVVRTDAHGRFLLSGVPVGLRTVVAGVDGPDARDGVTRLGSTQLNVVSTGNDDVTLRLRALGRIRGVVYDGSGGRRVPNVRVAIPTTGGFYWVNANANGEYEFTAMGLGGYTVSAPAPPVKKDAEQLAADALDALGEAQAGGSFDEAGTLVGELVNRYVQGSVGRLSSAEFLPGSWGFNQAALDFDGQTVVADIQYLPGASLAGVVVNSQDVPVGAEVTVRAFGPNKSGAPTMKEFGPYLSRPDSGRWSAGGFLVGPYSVTARSPLLVGEALVQGLLRPQEAALTNLVLRFPPQREVTGRLIGNVLNPDGSPASRASVQIDFAPDYVISTDTNGFFDTQIRLPERLYHLTATNLESGLVGQTTMQLVGGITNFAVVPLLGKGSLQIQVRDAAGRAAVQALVRLRRPSFPVGDAGELTTALDGLGRFDGLWEGDWQVEVEQLAGVNKAVAKVGTSLKAGVTNELTVSLGAVGRLQGLFVEDVTGRPITGAQVSAFFGVPTGPVFGSAPTDTEGAFELAGLPVGTYFLVARHPVSGRLGLAEARLGGTNATLRVLLKERPLGEVFGSVLAADGTNGVAGVTVRYEGPDRLSPARLVTTDPAGAFRFANVPVGAFHLDALEPVLHLDGRASGELIAESSPLRVDVTLAGLGSVEVAVFEPDGVTPATACSVTLEDGRGRTLETDASGRISFGEVPLRTFGIRARSNRPGELNSLARDDFSLTFAGQRKQLSLRLSGVAQIQGALRDGANRPAASAAIELQVALDGGGEVRRQTVTAANGAFVLSDLPLGIWRLQANLGALSAFAGGEFSRSDESTNLLLRLGASGTIVGSVIREKGGELRDFEVACFFTAQNGQPGFVRAVADAAGTFRAAGLPLGVPLQVRVEIPALDGRFLVVTNLALPDQTLDLGVLRLDQTPPEITGIVPTEGTEEVAARPTIEVGFSEPLRPASLRAEGFLLLQGSDRTAVDLVGASGPAGPDSVVRVVPREALRSAREYTLVVAGADQVDGSGRPVSLGPEDRMGRPLATTVTSRFRVRDYEPPLVLGAYPAPDAAEIELETPLRFEFDEPIRTNLLQVVLRGAGGIVPGTLGVNASQQLVAWVPASRLEANTHYRVELSGLTDLSGNAAPPRTNVFDTLDTRGPRIALLRLSAGQRPVANATVTLEAVLERAEPEAVVRFARGGHDLGIAFALTNATANTNSEAGRIYRWPVRLPAEGLVRLSAIGLDRSGNAGEPATLELRVGPNERPSVSLARVEPPTGPLETGRRFSFAVTARDDATLAALRLTARGSLEFTREITAPPNGTPTNLLFDLPTDFVAGADIEFRVVALDDSGATSEEAVLRYATRDATPPLLGLEAPLDGASLDPRQPLEVGLEVRDNSPSVAVTVLLGGVVTSSNRLSLALTPNSPQALPLSLALTNGLEGGAVGLTLRVEDAAGNRVEVARQYRLRGVVGPRFRFAQAVDRGSSWSLPDATSFSPWVSSVNFYFDKPLASRVADTNLLVVSNSLAMATRIVPHVSSSGVGVDLAGPGLPPGGVVTFRVLPGLADANGNAVLLADGSDFPPEGLVVSLRVASPAGWGLTNGTPVVAGQTIPVLLTHESAFARWEVSLNGTPAFTSRGATNGTTFFLTLATNATQARLVARNVSGDRPALELSPLDLRVRSRAGDDDGDGLPNGWEADHSYVNGLLRFNPFDPADAGADWDFDRLDNRAEYERGTDPFDSDTDHDGLTDANESTRGGCPDPFQADSDGDGVRDGDDLAPCVSGEALTLDPPSLTVPEGESRTNRVTVTGVGLSLLGFDFTAGSPRPAFIQFTDFAITGTNPIARQLVIRPSFADAGEHVVTFTVHARRATSVVTTNLTLKVIVEDRANTRFTRWARAQNGLWSQASNWTAGLPGIGTNAVIDQPGTYSVTLDTSPFVEALELGGVSGRQTLDLGGWVLTLNGASRVGSNAVVRLVRNSRLTGQGDLRVEGALEAENAVLEGAGLLELASSGRLSFPGGVTGQFPTLGRRIHNAGEVRIGTNVTLLVSGPSLVNQPGGRWILETGGMRSAIGSPQFENAGELRKRGTDTTTVSGVALEQRGVLVVEAGELSWESAPASFAAGSTSGGPGALRLFSTRGEISSPLDFTQGLTLTGSVVTNRTAQTWGRFTMSNATLDGPGDVLVTEEWGGSAAILLGSGTFRLGREAEARSTNTLVLARPVENLGHWLLQTNGLVFVDTLRLLNLGILEIPDVASFRWNSVFGRGSLENRGTVRKRGTGLLRISGVSFDNEGRVLVEGGALDLDFAGRNAGRIELSTGTRATLGAGFEHPVGSWLGGEGAVEFSSGTNDLRGELFPRGGLTVSGGVVTVRSAFDRPLALTLQGGRLSLEMNQDLAALTIRAGELSGSGAVTVRDSLDWVGGTLGMRSALVLESNAVSRLRSGNLAGPLENRGQLVVDPGAFLRFLNGELRNPGEVNLVGAATFFATGGTNLFDSTGTFRTGTNAVSFSGVPTRWRGIIELTPVVIRFDAGTNSTRLLIPSGGRLIFDQEFLHDHGSVLGGEGQIEFARGRQDVSGEFSGRGDLLFTGGEVTIQSGFTNAGRTLLRAGTMATGGEVSLRDVVFEGGALGISNRVSVSRSLGWTGGRLQGLGRLLSEPTALVQVGGFNEKSVEGTFEAGGDVQVTNNTRVLLNGGTWRVPGGSTNQLLGAVQFWVNGSGRSGTFQNDGTVLKSRDGAFDLDAVYAGTGTLEIAGGTADFAAPTRLEGLIRIATGSELHLAGTSNTWAAGAQFAGPGAFRVGAPGSFLRLERPMDLGELHTTFENGLRIQGEFPLSSGSGGSLTMRGSTLDLEGSLHIAERLIVALGTTVRIDDALELAPGGTLDNLGRRDGQNRSNIRVRALSAAGATLLGVPPEVVPAIAPLRVGWWPGGGEGSLAGAQEGLRPRLARSAASAERGLELRWDPTEADRLEIEISEDLIHWETLDLGEEEWAAGSRLIPVLIESPEGGGLPRTLFFRQRETRW